jgi:hypothetical protein
VHGFGDHRRIDCSVEQDADADHHEKRAGEPSYEDCGLHVITAAAGAKRLRGRGANDGFGAY